VIVTDVFAITCKQPADAGMVYVTVYVPAVLRSGLIAPVVGLMLRPAVDENVPPVVPVKVTGRGDVLVLQKGVPA
jgi:hypothetical protein